MRDKLDYTAIFRRMPPEPHAFERLEEPNLEAARTLRAEMGWLAERNAQRIRRLMILVTVGMLVLAVVELAAGGLAVKVALDESSQADKTTQALCTLDQNAAGRIQDSQNFLEAHPNGVAGISRSVIVAGIVRDKKTVTALAVLRCGGR